MASDRIVIPVPFWKRPEVSIIFWKNIEHQRSRGLDITVVAAVTDAVNIALAESNTDHIIRVPNDCVGKKWNKAVERCRELDFDRMLILGSDDIFSKELIDLYSKHLDPYIGLKDACAMSMYSKQVKYFDGYKISDRVNESVGSGRYLSREILEETSFKLFGNLNNNLDMSMTKLLASKGYKNKLVKTGIKPYRLGLKVQDSISGMFGSFNHRFTKEDLIDYYGEEVVNMIYQFE